MRYVYDFPPSDEIKQFGEIVKGSHFLADGNITLKDGRAFECNFEVAYIQSSFVAVVVYLTLPDSLNEYERHQIGDKLLNQDEISLSGKDRLWGFTVKVNELNFTRVDYRVSSLEPALVAYTAASYEVYAEDGPQSDKKAFLLVNFALPYWYSFEAKKWANEGEDEGEERVLKITVSGNTVGKIFYLKSRNKKSYVNEPLSYLVINQNDLSTGWTQEQLSETICVMLSLAVGHDIQFTNWHIPKQSQWLTTPHQSWISRSIKSKLFYGLVVEHYSEAHVNFDIVTTFLDATLTTLTQRPYTEVAEYIRLLKLYIDFASSSSISHTMQGRLLTTLAEEVYKVWEIIEHPTLAKNHKLVNRSERKDLIELIQAQILEQASDIFQKRVNESDELFQGRVTSICERLEPIIRENLNKETFVGKLKALFSFYGYEVNPEAYATMHKNILAFVNSRNSLVHAGCLTHENPDIEDKNKITFCTCEDHKRQHEMENILQMIPLMFAALLGYKGQYYSAITLRGNLWTTHYSEPK